MMRNWIRREPRMARDTYRGFKVADLACLALCADL